jgi:hypothetical protein
MKPHRTGMIASESGTLSRVVISKPDCQNGGRAGHSVRRHGWILMATADRAVDATRLECERLGIRDIIMEPTGRGERP